MDNCAGKLIRSNHRLMGTYVHLMPRMVQRRMEEMESKAAENAKAAEAAASASVGSATEASAASPPQIPGLLAPDVRMESHGTIIKPAGLDVPVNPDAAVSKFTDVKLSATTPLTPATEIANLSVLNKSGDGQSNTAGLPQPPIQ